MTLPLGILLSEIVDLSNDIENIEVSQLTLDSREVSTGSLFVALQGSKEHGVRYAKTAQVQGAVAILVEGDEQCEEGVTIPCINIAQLRSHLGIIADRFYGSPSASMTVIGVTGTDGKSSVSHFVADALNHAGIKTAVIGTLGVGMPGKLVDTGLTTPNVITLHKLLAQFKEEAVQTVIMEVSSHALDQERVNGVRFKTALLTNLGRDHLDYHKTIEAYAEAKEKLFERPELENIVINEGDLFGQKVLAKYSRPELAVMRFSSKDNSNSQLHAENVNYSPSGISADIIYQNNHYPLKVSVIGAFNLENILASIAVLLTMNFSIERAIEYVSLVQTVPGRMEKIPNEQGILVVVDYAHNPGALAAALQAVKPHTSNRILCVFGCGGDRDKGKRPLMAKVAEDNAQMVILTDDNPRSEMPFQIMHDMIEGLANPEFVAVEHDRAKAIQFAIKSASNGDTVLIAGKGHETTQQILDESYPFDDRKQAVLALAECDS